MDEQQVLLAKVATQRDFPERPKQLKKSTKDKELAMEPPKVVKRRTGEDGATTSHDEHEGRSHSDTQTSNPKTRPESEFVILNFPDDYTDSVGCDTAIYIIIAGVIVITDACSVLLSCIYQLIEFLVFRFLFQPIQLVYYSGCVLYVCMGLAIDLVFSPIPTGVFYTFIISMMEY